MVIMFASVANYPQPSLKLNTQPYKLFVCSFMLSLGKVENNLRILIKFTATNQS